VAGIEWRRLTHTAPEFIDEGHTGVTFVNILFGLVATSIAVAYSGTIVDILLGDADLQTRIWHLSVAAAVTILSFIGYHTSQHRPTFRLKIWNLPMTQFVLDVAMVFVYFLVLAFAEPVTETVFGEKVVIDATAKWEYALVAVAFLLYWLWDMASWLIERSRPYHDEREAGKPTGRPFDPKAPYGSRRWATVAFFVGMVVLALVVAVADPGEELAVILLDALLIVLLFGYRVAKQLVDPSVLVRPAAAESVDVPG
jgi:hypothetical protein